MKAKAMTDAQLHELALEYRTHRTAEKAAEVLADAAKDRILAELKRRKIETIPLRGVTITRKAGSRRHHDVSKLRTLIPRRLASALLRVEVDLKLWDAAIRAGEITPEIIDAVETKVTTAPYIDVTIAQAAA